MPLTTPFHQVSIGQRFEFRGRRYLKLALTLAGDENHYANRFLAQTEVLPHPIVSRPHRQVLLQTQPPEVA